LALLTQMLFGGGKGGATGLKSLSLLGKV